MLAVSAHIFSGRSNPEWPVTAGVEAKFLDAAKRLEPLRRPPGPLPGLGYAGMEAIWTDDCGEERRWLFFEGTARRGEQWYRDEDRAIERFLAQTGRGHIEPELLALLPR